MIPWSLAGPGGGVMNYWLLKSEPTVYSITDLARDRTTLWDGVRNYQARNYLRGMRVGDRAFFYHSNCTPPGIVGTMTVVESDLVDPSQFDPASPYHDPKATADRPRWWTVRLAHDQTWGAILPLDRLKVEFDPETFPLVRRGNRLSVMPLDPAIAARIHDLSQDLFL